MIVRSKLVPPHSATISEAASDNAEYQEKPDLSDELNYCRMLNSVLPKNIRVFAWSPVADSFDARFSATKRTYKYFCPRSGLNIEVFEIVFNDLKLYFQMMQNAGARLIGEHDYRNFCRIDKSRAGIMSFVRCIDDVRIELYVQLRLISFAADFSNHYYYFSVEKSTTTNSSRYEMLELTIVGSGFLWHQIRCIVGVLVEIGRMHEKPEVYLIQTILF